MVEDGQIVAGDRDPIGNTGLAERLEQHSRRNGFTLGVAMGACILIGLAGFIYLYTHITILPDFSQKLSVTDVPTSRAPSGRCRATVAGDSEGASFSSTRSPVQARAVTDSPSVVMPPPRHVTGT